MTPEGNAPGNNGVPDLSLLKEMVDVRKNLGRLVSQKQGLDKAAVLQILEAQQQAYEANALFLKKLIAIREIIAALKAGTVSVDAILQAAQVEPAPKPAQGFSLSRLFGRARSS